MQFKQAGSHGNTSCGGNSIGQPEFPFDFRIRRKFEPSWTWLLFWLVVYYCSRRAANSSLSPV